MCHDVRYERFLRGVRVGAGVARGVCPHALRPDECEAPHLQGFAALWGERAAVTLADAAVRELRQPRCPEHADPWAWVAAALAATHD